MRTLIAALALSTIAVSAQTGQSIALTIDSDIRGAAVYLGDVAQERPTPLTVSLTARANCTDQPKISVKWISGAEASVPALRLCVEDGAEQKVTFNHPSGTPWRDADELFARKVDERPALVSWITSGFTATASGSELFILGPQSK